MDPLELPDTVDRLSVHEDLPWKTAKYIVTLNGKVQYHAVEADAKEGYVVKYKFTEDGRMVLNRDRTEILTERLTGVVRITKIDDL